MIRSIRGAGFVCSVFALGALGCSSDGGEPADVEKTREALLDPETCKECHATHYEQWAGSMHAYAADDPVFRAMNARGQEETGGHLGPFCVNCHAPMAVREGLTEDGTNLDEVPKAFRGVTCYFCHNTVSVNGTHNAPIDLADDVTMRGGIGGDPSEAPPADNPIHDSEYSALLDGAQRDSASLCGSCHDIQVPGFLSGASEDVHLERTFAEWKDTLFATPEGLTTCSSCHTQKDPELSVIAEYEGVPGGRTFHRHDWEGIDVALEEFPNRERQLGLIQSLLDTTLLAELCVYPQNGTMRVVLHNGGAGHSFPSGATQDRRAWVELVAYDGDAKVYESGVVAPGEPVAHLDDPSLWLFRSKGLDRNGEEAHMFWDIASLAPDSFLIPGASLVMPGIEQVGNVYRAGAPVTRVTVQVRVRPMGLEVLADLVESGHLEEYFLDAIPTFELKRAGRSVLLEWTEEAAGEGVKEVDGFPARCVEDKGFF